MIMAQETYVANNYTFVSSTEPCVCPCLGMRVVITRRAAVRIDAAAIGLRETISHNCVSTIHPLLVTTTFVAKCVVGDVFPHVCPPAASHVCSPAASR